MTGAYILFIFSFFERMEWENLAQTRPISFFPPSRCSSNQFSIPWKSEKPKPKNSRLDRAWSKQV